MNESESARFRDIIARRIAELDTEDALGRDGQGVVTLDQQSVGRLSRMDALQSQAMAKAGQARRDAERRRLARTLERIDEGEFGYCDGCGEEIPVRRLELDPTATRCVECASS